MGSVAWMMDGSTPELASIVETAAADQWTSSQIASALQQTQWWKTNGDAVKQFQQTQATDPGQAQALVAASKADVQAYATSIGVSLTDSQATGIATQSATFQWNTSQMQAAVKGMYQAPAAGGTNVGGAADIQSAIQTTAGNYLQTANTDAINWWVGNAVKAGDSAQQASEIYGQYLANQTKQLYPWMSTAIDQGLTPKDYLSPYTTMAANTLGVSPDSVNWSDPKWTAALLQTNPTTGLQVPVNTDQFNKNLMQNPTFGYSKTQNAINQAYTVSKQLEQTFGKTAS
jgi:hypothetical protein